MFRGPMRQTVQRHRGGVLAALVVVALAAVASSASAAFHLMKVREVYPGASNDSYVVLQMLFKNENALGNHALRLYDAGGATIDTFTFSAGYVASKADHGNNTILIGDTGVETTFGVAPDDHVDANLNVPASGGAVCWLDGSPPDCVAWGNFSGSLPNPAGSPASPPGVTAGKALHRKISGSGCATYLESSDDTNNSASDFSEQNPSPRNNAMAPAEMLCPSLPNTTIGAKPADPTKATSASLAFSANPAAGASFECKLDAEPDFTSCSSPQEYMALSEGTHTFEVRAVNSAGADPSPAAHSWRVDLTPPTTTILTQPPDPAPGNSAAFTYSSNEAGSTFQCSLSPTGQPDGFSACPGTGKTYPDAAHPGPLANGSWTFKVRATDPATNLGSPDTFTWTVDNALNDETPPQTTIVAKPPDPSDSSTASFAYESNEPRSTFECKLDDGAFAGCPPAGIAYSGLTNGPHSFQVRARDESGNVDLTPAGHSWAVAVLALIEAPAFPQPQPQPAAPTPAPPETTITGKPGAQTRDRTPTFRFRSSAAGSAFQCKVDRGAFRACASPFTTKKLAFGAHAVEVRAVAGGAADPSPAKSRFRVLKPRRVARRP